MRQNKGQHGAGLNIYPVRLLQIRSVTGDHLFIPPERFLTFSLQRTVAAVITIDIHETVAFAHFTGGCRHQIDTAPRGVTDDRNTVGNGLAHRLNMLTQITNAVIIIDFATLVNFSFRTQAIFHQK